MSAITLIITNAGRAALVNAANAGTFAVQIASAGLTASSFTPLATATTLPGEFARITGISGSAVDPDTITLNIRDDSNAVYTLRGLGLFLTDGTLFAIYSQTAAILEKAANSTALIVLDVRFADINATNLTFGNANFLNPPATTTAQGVIELATDAEAVAATDSTRAIVPTALKAVLDNRFGVGAASSFVKTLLTAANQAAFRLLLSIKSAALKDEGAGNGLDADLLDGLQTHNAGTGQAGGPWPSVPIINNTGVMEIGRHIDFHILPNDVGDYTGRLGLDNDGSFIVNGARLWHAGNDGAGSGLDADLFDGLPTHNAATGNGGGPWPSVPIVNSTGVMEIGRYIDFHILPNDVGDFSGRLGLDNSGRLAVNDGIIWHTGNDGSGSGLDADLLDGQDGSWYSNIPARLGFAPANRAGDTFTGRMLFAASGTGGSGMNNAALGLGEIEVLGSAGGAAMMALHRPGSFYTYFGMDTDNRLKFGGGSYGATAWLLWHAGNDGAGSGLDADLLDGRDSGSFANASHGHGASDVAGAWAGGESGANGWMRHPNGIIEAWGQYREFITSEGGRRINFDGAPFTAEPWNVQLTGANLPGANSRDMFVQVVARDTGGFNVYIQKPTDSGAQLDGFDWRVLGR